MGYLVYLAIANVFPKLRKADSSNINTAIGAFHHATKIKKEAYNWWF